MSLGAGIALFLGTFVIGLLIGGAITLVLNRE
jgi:hypothetical protein